ncbi:MAG TPA: proton-conducting transporter membrane subunit, partial [Rugosimonospora sp.]|nr:proton-conducting transporter membrane subunit [Rugosimonospora sp.]
MRIDQVALLPAYCAAGTALLAFAGDLIAPGRARLVVALTAAGAVTTGVVAVLVGRGPTRATFCAGPVGCSYVADHTGALVAALFAGLTLAVLGLSVATGVPMGEYCFLLGCSMAGGVVLGYARDLISLIVAIETLTLPLYLLVGLRGRPAAGSRSAVEGASAAITFFVVSVVSAAVALLGAALLYAVTGAVHFTAVAAALAGHPDARTAPLTGAAIVLLLAGLSFKVAAVPFHAWAPAAYDGGPVPVAAYLSTASKLGGVIAILSVTARALGPALNLAGPALALLAVLTMTVGNLAALRQVRMVRLLAWSSIAQAGYILAPLGALALSRGRTPEAVGTAVAASLGYTFFYVVLEVGAFAAVVALRGAFDGGAISDYRGAFRRAPWVTAAFVLALVGLAGLPPGLAGLFAKVVVVRSLLDGGSVWLAVVVAVNAVI